jgi:hypothetical protein
MSSCWILPRVPWNLVTLQCLKLLLTPTRIMVDGKTWRLMIKVDWLFGYLYLHIYRSVFEVPSYANVNEDLFLWEELVWFILKLSRHFPSRTGKQTKLNHTNQETLLFEYESQASLIFQTWVHADVGFTIFIQDDDDERELLFLLFFEKYCIVGCNSM